MKKSILIMLIFLSISQDLFNQDIDPDTIKIHLNSPRDAMYIHNRYVQPETYYPEISAKAMNINKKEHLRVDELAERLQKIMDAKALIINFSKVPNDSLVLDSTSGKYIYYPFRNMPDIYLERIGNKWKYSRYTCDNIDAIYDRLYLFKLNHFVENLPDFFRKEVGLSIQVWQILSFIILLFVGLIIKIIFSLIGRLVCKQIFGRTRFAEFYITHVLRNVNTLATILGLSSVYFLLPNLELPVKVNFILTIIFKGLIPLFVTMIAFRMADYFSERIQKRQQSKNKKLHENFLPFLKTTFKVFIVIIGLLFILVSLGIDILPLLAGVSIGGIAIALAAQETIKNIFGSITVFSDRPFDVGDWIIFQGGEGIVEEIGVRSTRIRSFNNSIITVPNGKLMDMTIDNMGRREFRRYVLNLDVKFETSLEVIELFIEGIRNLIQLHPTTNKDNYHVYLINITSTVKQILVQTHFLSTDMEGEYVARQSLLLEILKLAEILRIQFAVPIHSIDIKPDHLLNEEEVKSVDQLKAEMQKFLAMKKQNITANDIE